MSEDTLHDKYRVERRHDPEGKHDACRFFVLDPQHDEAARSAMRHYAESTSNDALAVELLYWLDDLDSQGGAPRCGHSPAGPPDEPMAPGDVHRYNPDAFCRGGCGQALSTGDPWRRDGAR